MSLSSAKRVVNVTSIRSVSAGERFRWVAAVERRVKFCSEVRGAGRDPVYPVPFANFFKRFMSFESNCSASCSIASCSFCQPASCSLVGKPGIGSGLCAAKNSRWSKSSTDGKLSRSYQRHIIVGSDGKKYGGKPVSSLRSTVFWE